MPIEILELVVKANISEGPTSTENTTSCKVASSTDPALDKKILTEDIVEQVLAIMQYQNER